MSIRTTALAILKASESPQLIKEATACFYVTHLADGTIKHCLVGQVLADLGMDDATLIGEECDHNSSAITSRQDLRAFIRDHDLDLNTLNEAQIAFDDQCDFPQYLVELREEISIGFEDS